MADYLVTDTELTSIADAIRTKGGTSASLTFPTGFVSAVNDIPSGGPSSTTVTFGEYSFPYTNGFITYVDGNGTVQKTTDLNAPSNIDMMSGSILVVGDNMSFQMLGTFNTAYISGMTLVYDTSFTVASRATLYYRVFQVD